MLPLIAVACVIAWLVWRGSSQSMNVFSKLGLCVLAGLFVAAMALGSDVTRGHSNGGRHSWAALEWWHYAIWAVMWLGPVAFFWSSKNIFTGPGMVRMAAFVGVWFVLGLVLDPLFDGGCAPGGMLTRWFRKSLETPSSQPAN